MNYRHAFHAGNFADCVKHALLVALLRALLRKPAPFRVLDTHAGIGHYELAAPEPQRTGEWRSGIARVMARADEALADYRTQVAAAGFPAHYPGSPALIRALLREGDRLSVCELHPDDHATLRTRFAGDAQVSVHKRDAYEAVTALTPFPERRGLILLDPPFERDDEFDHVARREAAVPDCIAAELTLREPTDPARLNGCGLLVANAPFGFDNEARGILNALLACLSQGETGAGATLIRVTEER